LNLINSRPKTMQSNQLVAVHCGELTKSYGSGDAQVHALRGVNLDIRYGELLMLVGPSGCGKTTLLSIIGGILDPDGGQCSVLDHDFQHMGTGDRARFRGGSIGFVFQSFNLLPSLTAVENVAVPLLINGMPRRDAAARARAVLDTVELGGRADASPAQLSGGQQQRVAIARALVHEPKLIVCDEPTSNLDHAAGHQVMAILRRVAQSPDRALVVVTHDARIFEFADRIAHMDDGRIVEVSGGTSERPQ
jgi:putative ABC transport system ATP-binding protein